jgi:hypothetical protein
MLGVPVLSMLDRELQLYIGLLDQVDTPRVRSVCMATLSAMFSYMTMHRQKFHGTKLAQNGSNDASENPGLFGS